MIQETVTLLLATSTRHVLEIFLVLYCKKFCSCLPTLPRQSKRLRKTTYFPSIIINNKSFVFKTRLIILLVFTPLITRCIYNRFLLQYVFLYIDIKFYSITTIGLLVKFILQFHYINHNYIHKGKNIATKKYRY